MIEQKIPDSETIGAMRYLLCEMVLREMRTQADFVNALRNFDNGITDIFAQMLEEGLSGWKLILRRTRRGAPRNEEGSDTIMELYTQEIEERGKRNAIKRLAKKYNMKPDAIRSAIRRAQGTHCKDRTENRGPFGF